MLRPASSLLAFAVCLSTLPALADEPKASDAADAATQTETEAPPPRAPALPPAAPPPAAPPPPYAPWPRMERPTERLSTGAVASGIIFTVAGSLGLAVGTGIYQGASGTCNAVKFGPGGPVDFQQDCSDATGKVVGMVVLISSAVVVAGGVALWIYGAQQVPKSDKREPTESAKPGLSLGLNAGSATLRWSF